MERLLIFSLALLVFAACTNHRQAVDAAPDSPDPWDAAGLDASVPGPDPSTADAPSAPPVSACFALELDVADEEPALHIFALADGQYDWILNQASPKAFTPSLGPRRWTLSLPSPWGAHYALPVDLSIDAADPLDLPDPASEGEAFYREGRTVRGEISGSFFGEGLARLLVAPPGVDVPSSVEAHYELAFVARHCPEYDVLHR